MRLITARTIEEYGAEHAELRRQLSDWCAMVEAARWHDANEVLASSSFPVRPIGNKRLVFNIKGGDYRLVCAVRYADTKGGLNGIVFVHFIGTHAEYDSIDPATVTYKKS